jgi:SAM-dependent methyltransferase
MTEENTVGIHAEIAAYYSDKLAAHGQSPRGVDWNGEEGQILRFRQLLKIIDRPGAISINDLGCGYGALYEFLASEWPDVAYVGADISESMVEAARERFKGRPNARFIKSSVPDCISDYGVASGIFNVRMGRTNAEWQVYLEATLDQIDRTSRLGFAFNCLTSYSDVDRMRSDLHYADPCRLFDLCKRRYSKNVALNHDYGLYEFTILVRKQV